MPLDPVIVARIVALIQDGRGQRETARIVGKSLCAVQNVYQRYEETGLITRRPGSGRKRITTQRDDRFLVSTSLRNRTASAVLLRNQLQEVRDVNISEWTVRRRLCAAGLSCRRMATGPPLQRRHRIARLAFARNHLAWNDEDWSNELFSDESRFCLNRSDGRRRVWRRPGERYAPVCIDERLPFGGGSVMVWAGISSEARIDLVFIQNGSLTAHRYITEVLEDHVMPFMITVGEHGILMHDNARPHAAVLSEDIRMRSELGDLIGQHSVQT
jgi:transposase